MRVSSFLSLSLVIINLVDAAYYSYEKKVNSIDDGYNQITDYQMRKYDSSVMRQPRIEGKTIVMPSKYKNGVNSMKLRKQRNTNNIGTGFEMKMPLQWLNSYFGKDHGSNLIRRARSVEPPAMSVDSGGQPSASIAGELAKILNVKQGFYADVYNRIDRPKMTTRRPVDVIEDTMKKAVQQSWGNRSHRR